MNIGEKIRRLRIEKMMTQAELSGDQVTRNMLSLIEKGKAVPSLQTLTYIASRLNVSPSILLADENEEKILYKSAKISNIKLAFKKCNYRICMGLCDDFDDVDDEIFLIMAESAIKIAVEEIFADRVRPAWTNLDKAVLCATKSIYDLGHIEAQALLLFDYLGELSPSLVSEYIDVDLRNTARIESFCLKDEFLRYVLGLKKIKNGESFEIEFENAVYQRHLECKMYIRDNEYEKAYRILNDLLRIDQRISGVMLYDIFNDLEICCVNLGNTKSAGSYSIEKVSQLERILSQ